MLGWFTVCQFLYAVLFLSSIYPVHNNQQTVKQRRKKTFLSDNP